MLPIQTFANCLSHWKNKDLHFLWRNLHLSVWVSYKGKALNVSWSIYLTQVCSFILQTLSWLFMCFQWLTCFAVKLATEQIRQIFFFFGYPIFIAFFLVCSVTVACKLVGEHVDMAKGKAGCPLQQQCGVGAPGPATKLAVRATACYFRVGSLPSLPFSTLLPGTFSRLSLHRDPTWLLLSAWWLRRTIDAFKRLRFLRGLSQFRK